MKHMFNTIVEPHIDYCFQLWMPQEGQILDKVEKLLRDFTRKIPGLKRTELLGKTTKAENEL